jgi:hypothetical protein
LPFLPVATMAAAAITAILRNRNTETFIGAPCHFIFVFASRLTESSMASRAAGARVKLVVAARYCVKYELFNRIAKGQNSLQLLFGQIFVILYLLRSFNNELRHLTLNFHIMTKYSHATPLREILVISVSS